MKKETENNSLENYSIYSNCIRSENIDLFLVGTKSHLFLTSDLDHPEIINVTLSSNVSVCNNKLEMVSKIKSIFPCPITDFSHLKRSSLENNEMLHIHFSRDNGLFLMEKFQKKLKGPTGEVKSWEVNEQYEGTSVANLMIQLSKEKFQKAYKSKNI